MAEVAQNKQRRKPNTRFYSQRRKPNTRLYALRINAGLSRRDLAYRTGLSAETIRIAELGYVPGPHAQFAIAQAFKLEPLDLWPLERQKALP